MSVPPNVVQLKPTGTRIPSGWTINGNQVPANTHFTQGAGRAHYEKPRITENRVHTGFDRNHYLQRLRYEYTPSGSRNVGRTAETSFSNPEGARSDPFQDISRNTEGTRQRRPVSRQSTSGSSGGSVRPASSSRGNAASHDTRIEIPQHMSESMPLLEGARNSGLSSVLSGGVVSGLGAAGAATALGVGTTALVNRIKNKGAVLPGTDYVGPGNDIKIDAPRSGSDVVAKEHDVGYADLQHRAELGQLSEQEFVEGIDYLDNTAIQKFADNFKSSGEWQSFLGRWGLWLKNRIERVTGPIYPKFPGKKWANGRIFLRMRSLIGIA